MRYEIDCLKTESARHECKSKSVFDIYLSSDEKVSKFTGLLSIQQFNDLFCHVENSAKEMKYWYGLKRSKTTSDKGKKRGPKRSLSQKEEFLLVLMKCRQGIHNDLLSEIFGISETSVSIIFTTWIKHLARELKPLIKWPSKESVKMNMPVCLSQFKNLRCTIDCTEIFIEKPRDRQIQSFVLISFTSKHSFPQIEHK